MNILVIAPIYFDYEKAICNVLATKYSKVVFRSDVPFNSSVKYYALRRLSVKLAQRALEKYAVQLEKIVAQQSIERIFIVKGLGVQESFLKTVRKKYPRVEIINYQWDSIQNNPNGEMISKYAHSNFSFDLADVAKYPQFKHLPLFYTWEKLGENRKRPAEFKKDIDLLFIGGYHSKRHEIVSKAKQECEKQGLTMYSHIYFPKGSYLRDRLTTKQVNRSDVSFKTVSRAQYYELLCRSKAVLDIQSATQTGATIRTFEALSVGVKVVSTNGMLKNEKFFTDVNIKIWDTLATLQIAEFSSSEFDHSKDDYVLSIQRWLEAMDL